MNLPLCLLSHPILKKIQQQQQQHNRNKSKTFSEQSKWMWGWNPQKPMKLDENDTILSHHPYILCNFAMSVFFSTQLPEIHPSSVIYYWILLPCFLIYTVLHTPNACCRNSVKSNWVKRGLKSKYGYLVVYIKRFTHHYRYLICCGNSMDTTTMKLLFFVFLMVGCCRQGKA